MKLWTVEIQLQYLVQRRGLLKAYVRLVVVFFNESLDVFDVPVYYALLFLLVPA